MLIVSILDIFLTFYNKLINLSIPIAKPIPPSYSPPPHICLDEPKSSHVISKP